MPETETLELNCAIASAADFAPHIGGSFTIETNSAKSFALELVEASEVNSSRPRPMAQSAEARCPFSLLFRGPARPILPQAIYNLRHEVLGKLAIFLVPLGPTQGGSDIIYEAVFN